MIIWVSLLAGAIYLVIYLITFIYKLLIDKDVSVNFKRSKRYNAIILPLSICISIIFSCCYLFYNPAHNYKTAYIEKDADKYSITVFGKRNLMAHDPVSLLKKETYIDSVKFEIPRAEGIIDGLEIPNVPGYYKILKGNAIEINSTTIKISLFYDNYDNKKIDSSGWNGIYKLEWRNKK